MADETGDVLRQSLDAVDRYRKRLIAGLVFTTALLLLVFFGGLHATRAGAGALQALVAHFVLLVVWIGAMTIVIVLQIAAMTRRILRAIEITARR